MRHRTEGHFSGYDGIELFYQTWLQPNPLGTLVVTHGLSEHSECYSLFADGLADSGWDIYAWDLRGHGRSDGKRGLVFEFSEFCRDLNIFVNHVSQSRAGGENPLVLIGHSMGGLISSRTLIDFSLPRINALCLSSPAFGISMPVPQWKEKSARFLSHWAPRVTMANEINYSRLSHDEEVLSSYERDPLRHNKISPRLFLGMVESFNHVLDNAAKLNLPILLQAAGKDQVVDTAKAEAFLETAGSDIKEKFIYKNSFHEIFNDIERRQVYSDLMDFLRKRIPSSSAQ